MKIPNIKKSLTIMGFLFTFFIMLNILSLCNNGHQNERLQFDRFVSIFKNRDAVSLATKFATNSDIRKEEENIFGGVLTNHKENNFSSGVVFVLESVVDWKKTNVQTLSLPQIMDYFSWTNQSSCQIAQHFGGIMVSSATGVISMEGQKAICLDYAVRPVGKISGIPGRCIVYSFGINYDWSFDEAMELYGCEIFSFDPSMNVSSHNRTSNIHFYQMALGSVDKDGWEKSPSIPTRTLSSIFDMLRPMHDYDSIIDYLKIDIETTEWQVLPQIMKSEMMDKVRQLAIEIHIDFNKSIASLREQASIIQSLEIYGLVRFDSKPNVNTLAYGTNHMKQVTMFNGYEIAWYNKRLFRKPI